MLRGTALFTFLRAFFDAMFGGSSPRRCRPHALWPSFVADTGFDPAYVSYDLRPAGFWLLVLPCLCRSTLAFSACSFPGRARQCHAARLCASGPCGGSEPVSSPATLVARPEGGALSQRVALLGVPAQRRTCQWEGATVQPG